MKDWIFKNERGEEVRTKIMSIDELYAVYKKIGASNPFYSWLEALKEESIITPIETDPGDKFVVTQLV